MSKHRRRGRRKNQKKKILTILFLVVLFLGFGVVLLKGNTEKDSEQIQRGVDDETIVFPYMLDDGNIEIASLFQFDGINSDCNNKEGSGIAAIELKNCSENYLSEAEITVVLADETELEFEITEIPAGKSVMAFAKSNTSIEQDAMCIEMNCEARYGDGNVSNEEKVSASVDGVSIKLTNMTEEDITECTVYCHSVLGDMLFGGTSFSYTVKDIASKETADVIASDCILGMAEIVRIEMK